MLVYYGSYALHVVRTARKPEIGHYEIRSAKCFKISVATHLRFGGISNNDFVANLLLSLTMKEFLKSFGIWQLRARVQCLLL